jgi:endonuclease/exonuclease/phosphatase family metal-dependent hydrolase
MEPRTTLGAGLIGLVCAAILVVVAANSAPTPGRRAGDPGPLTVATYNMAGGHPYFSWRRQAPEALARTIDERGDAIAFIGIQEACRDWSADLDRRLPHHSVRFDPVRTDNRTDIRCRNPIFGNALLFRDDLGVDSAPVGHSLGSPAGTEQREMLCVRSRARRLVLCTAHLTHDNEAVRRAEATTAHRILTTEYAGYTKIVGADLNDAPRSAALDGFYHPAYKGGARGGYKEAGSPCGNAMRERVGSSPDAPYCRAGAPTFGSGARRVKIDYVFVSPEVVVHRSGIGPTWPARGSGAGSSRPATGGPPEARLDAYSDHRPLWAEITP